MKKKKKISHSIINRYLSMDVEKNFKRFLKTTKITTITKFCNDASIECNSYFDDPSAILRNNNESKIRYVPLINILSGMIVNEDQTKKWSNIKNKYLSFAFENKQEE